MSVAYEVLGVGSGIVFVKDLIFGWVLNRDGDTILMRDIPVEIFNKMVAQVPVADACKEIQADWDRADACNQCRQARRLRVAGRAATASVTDASVHQHIKDKLAANPGHTMYRQFLTSIAGLRSPLMQLHLLYYDKERSYPRKWIEELYPEACQHRAVVGFVDTDVTVRQRAKNWLQDDISHVPFRTFLEQVVGLERPTLTLHEWYLCDAPPHPKGWILDLFPACCAGARLLE